MTADAIRATIELRKHDTIKTRRNIMSKPVTHYAAEWHQFAGKTNCGRLLRTVHSSTSVFSYVTCKNCNGQNRR